MALPALTACTLYFCFKLFDVNGYVNISPHATSVGVCEDGYRLSAASEIVALHDMGGYIAWNRSLVFLMRNTNDKLAIMHIRTGNETDGLSFHITTKYFRNGYVSHKLCVLSDKTHEQNYIVFSMVALIAMSVFGAIIVVYLIVLFGCLCRSLFGSTCYDITTT